MSRNLSLHEHFQNLSKKHTPKWRFAGSTRKDWLAWRKGLLPAVKATLGRLPGKVPLKPEILAEWREDGLIKQKIVFNVEDGLSANALLYRPENMKGRLPAILACHGHGPYGKDAIMGVRAGSPIAANIKEHNYDYGFQMAKAGYAVIAIDWRGFGERDDRRKPYGRNTNDGRDLCNLHYLRATILGMTVLGMNVHDGQCALDYLCAQSFVDASRIGVMGLSFGGTMTTWMAICDDRIKAADIICYSDRFADFGMRDLNFCGSQITPGLYAQCDVPDLQGLIAPRLLLVEIGIADGCFLLDSAMSCYHEVKKIFAAADVPEKLDLDLFEGEHGWGGRKSFDFFAKM